MVDAPLDSVCTRISSGGTPSRKDSSYFSSDQSGHLWVKSKELLDRAIEDTEEHITDSGLANSSAKYFPASTVLVAMYGANVGQLGWLRRPATVNQAICGLVVDELKADWRFVFYSLLMDRGDLTVQAQGAAQQNLNQDLIRQFCISFPSLPVQQRIAGILSAYDELIENSQRRIKILESMARALYREWFVYFRYPGHDSVSLVPSALGDIPQGWEVRDLFELTKVNYGKNLPTNLLADDGEFPVYGAAKVIGRYTEYTRQHRTIICGCRGSVGEVQITLPQCYVTNNSFTFDLIQTEYFFWLFHAIQERGLRDVVGGAAQPQITLEGISSVKLVSPPFAVVSSFQQSVSAIFEQAWALNSKIQNLRDTRDLLLPRLLSGQIDMGAVA